VTPNRVNFPVKYRSALYPSLAVIAACIVSYEFFDITVARFFASHKGGLTAVFEYITELGKSLPYLIISAAAFVWFGFLRKNRFRAAAAAFIFASVALSGIANDLIKFLVGRSRPDLLLTRQIYWFKPLTIQYSYNSFPSGHANTAAALFYSLYLIRDRYRYICLAMAALIILSRVIVEAHFLSDVLFGAYLGVLVTSLLKIAFEKKGWQLKESADGADIPTQAENA